MNLLILGELGLLCGSEIETRPRSCLSLAGVVTTWDLGQFPLQLIPTTSTKGSVEMGVRAFPSCRARMGGANPAPEALFLSSIPSFSPLPAWPGSPSLAPCPGLLMLPLSTVEEPGAAPEQWNDAGAAECGRGTAFQGLQEVPIVSQLCHSRGEIIPISLCIISLCIKPTAILFLPP